MSAVATAAMGDEEDDECAKDYVEEGEGVGADDIAVVRWLVESTLARPGRYAGQCLGRGQSSSEGRKGSSRGSGRYPRTNPACLKRGVRARSAKAAGVTQALTGCGRALVGAAGSPAPTDLQAGRTRGQTATP
ncbi:MAG: hypothetical protein ABI939_04305 [Anaerolineaceae bacterium]